MKKYLFLILCVAVILPASGAIKWLEKDFDFGTFKELGGPKTGVSRFVNLGPDTISILNVKPSCGCTSVDHTRSLILPGDTARISYTYDPSFRPGKFEKSVRVTLSGGIHQIIRIRGNVIGTPESLASLYPIEAGQMRLTDHVAPFGETVMGHSPVAFINAYVISPDTIVPALVSDNKALTVSPSVAKAGPGDVVTFTLSLDTKAAGVYGPAEFPLHADGLTAEVKATAVILPDATTLKIQQQGKSPVLEISDDLLDLGSVGSSPQSAEFIIKNEGKGPLDILGIYTTTDALKITEVPKSVKPGKSAKVKAALDPEYLSPGAQRQKIEILTNDPARTRATVNVALIK